MHPVLLRFGEFKIYSYSVFVVVAFFCAFTYAYFEAKRIGEKPQKVVDLSIYLFIGAFLGARLLHIVIEWRYYLAHPLEVFKIWQGGLVFYGGLIMDSLILFLYLSYHKMGFGKWLDLFSPCAMISLAVGRIGCFLNGCCYGSPAPKWLWWKVIYPIEMMPLKYAGIALHPVQIYESIGTGIITLTLLIRSRRKSFSGEIAILMLILYSILRFMLEFFRGDQRGGIEALGLSSSQVISIFILLISVALLVRIRLKMHIKTRGAEQL